MDEIIVIDTGPLIALSRFEALDVLDKLPNNFMVPKQVLAEIRRRPNDVLALSFPSSIQVATPIGPKHPFLSHLDVGEAAVIQLAIERRIGTVCLDERKGRTAAERAGLFAIGSLGLLGRAKKLAIVPELRPLISKARASGIYYDDALVEDFLKIFGE